MNDERKPRSKTVVLLVVIGVILAGLALYYITAIGTSQSTDVVLLST